MDILSAMQHVRTGEQLRRDGTGSRALAAFVESGDLVRIHRGHYVSEETWKSLHPEERHCLQVVAAASAAQGSDRVVTLFSAAAMWGLPLPRAPLDRVHIASPTTDGRTRSPVAEGAWIARHEVTIPRNDRVEINGIVCASLMRTVADLLRLARRETAISVGDAALRLVAANAGEHSGQDGVESNAAVAWRGELVHRLARIHGARGIKQARELAPRLDARAHLPGESISRLYLEDLGFARPRLQVPIEGPHDSSYFVDFGLDDVQAWGEFDGVGKYTDPAYTAHRQPWEVLAAEKERHDWIHARTGRPIVRWGMRDIASLDTFRDKLAALSLHPPRRWENPNPPVSCEPTR